MEYPDGREIKGLWDMGKLVEVDQQINGDSDDKSSLKEDEPLINHRVKLEKVYESPSK